mmetsp:Transcript_36750/g.84612  ORF Transcript_36750/g.84612 Transcript_36750/m.84612 type:complete len:355 (+) Transcript_36750:60-1124(+)
MVWRRSSKSSLAPMGQIRGGRGESSDAGAVMDALACCSGGSIVAPPVKGPTRKEAERAFFEPLLSDARLQESSIGFICLGLKPRPAACCHWLSAPAWFHSAFVTLCSASRPLHPTSSAVPRLSRCLMRKGAARSVAAQVKWYDFHKPSMAFPSLEFVSMVRASSGTAIRDAWLYVHKCTTNAALRACCSDGKRNSTKRKLQSFARKAAGGVCALLASVPLNCGWSSGSDTDVQCVSSKRSPRTSLSRPCRPCMAFSQVCSGPTIGRSGTSFHSHLGKDRGDLVEPNLDASTVSLYMTAFGPFKSLHTSTMPPRPLANSLGSVEKPNVQPRSRNNGQYRSTPLMTFRAVNRRSSM